MKFTSFSHFFTPLRCCNDINPPLHAQGQTSQVSGPVLVFLGLCEWEVFPVFGI